MRLVRHIPNTITCLNAVAGSLACVYALQGRYTAAALAIAAAAAFDFLDGLSARLLHQVSAIGKELDSLCDMISFGLAPSLLLFHGMTHGQSHLLPASVAGWLPFIAFLMVALSAVRLARFNLDEKQEHSFIGLPTPANALMWAFGLAACQRSGLNVEPLFAAVGTVIFSLLLVWPLPMFSLKFKNLSWKDNRVRFLFLAACLTLVLTMGFSGVAMSVLLYVLLCLFLNLFGPCHNDPA